MKLDVEVLVLKWSLGFCFIGVTYLFILKILMLFTQYANMKFAELTDFFVNFNFLEFLGMIK